MLIRASIALLLIATCVNPSLASDADFDKRSTNTPDLSFLEGKTFSGNLGAMGEPASATDLLVFEDGKFVSEGCQRRCGYTDGDYWLREDGNSIQVKAVTPCLESDATIHWEGVVDGDTIEGVFTWVNRRWYWTFEKQYWFKGKLVDANEEMSIE